MSLGNTVLQLFFLFLFMVLISLVSVLNLLYFYISTFRSMCAVPNMAVFCSSLTSHFPGMLLTYFLNDFEIVPAAPIITGITFVFTFHMRCISIVRSLHFIIIIVIIIMCVFGKSCSGSHVVSDTGEVSNHSSDGPVIYSIPYEYLRHNRHTARGIFTKSIAFFNPDIIRGFIFHD